MSVVKLPADVHGNIMKTDGDGKPEFANETVTLEANLYGTNEHGSLLIVGRKGTPVSKQLLKRGLKDKSLSYEPQDFHRKNRRERELADREAMREALETAKLPLGSLPADGDGKITLVLTADKPVVAEEHREDFEKDLTHFLNRAREEFGNVFEKLAARYEKKSGADKTPESVSQPNANLETTTAAHSEKQAGEPSEPVKPFQTTKAHVLAAQNHLTGTKHFSGEVTGKMTDDFRDALKVWQKENELEETGTLNEVTFKALGIEPEEKSE